MIIILSLSVLFAVSMVIWLIKRGNDFNSWWAFPATVGVLLCFALLILLVDRAVITSKIIGFKATQETMVSARANKDISALELAAIQRDAIEKNSWLEQEKYWHLNPWTSWFVPAEVMNLKPIR